MFTLRNFFILISVSFVWSAPVWAQGGLQTQNSAIVQNELLAQNSSQVQKPVPKEAEDDASQGKAVDTKGEGAQNGEKAEDESGQTGAASEPDGPAKEDENLFDIVKKGGVMMIPLVLLGLLGLTLVIERAIFHYKNKSWRSELIDAELEKAASDKSIRFSEELEKRLQEVRDLYIDKLERGMGLIQGIGNIAPLLGFLGTVIGMINAFSAIAAARTVNAKVVASGIQVALVTTAGGLLVAVPVLAAFYFLNHINQNHHAGINRKIAELIKRLPSALNDGDSSSSFSGASTENGSGVLEKEITHEEEKSDLSSKSDTSEGHSETIYVKNPAAPEKRDKGQDA